MKKAAMVAVTFCILSCAASALAQAQKTADVQLSDKDKATATVEAFLEYMDQEKYDEAFAYMDFDTLLAEVTRKTTAKLTDEQKAAQIKSFKDLAKNMFLTEKKKTKYRNFSVGDFVKTGDKATLSIINKPPKDSKDSPNVKIFKMVRIKDEWKIYGTVLQKASTPATDKPGAKGSTSKQK